ncbi:hypothetical protein [Pararhizobium arenae]|uniref:hypothetical protein n=1 Tax=Pararhizobium arenae TaxID=1856850 RepID=UPI00094AEEA4|nr:hypothetical protein [Pararhizobium arenae]
MARAFDEASIMPDAATMEKIHVAIDEYNGQRPAVLQEMERRRLPTMVPFGVICALVLGVVVARFQEPRFIGFVIGVMCLVGYFLWKEANRPMAQFRQTLRDRMLPVIFGFAGQIRYRNGTEPKFMKLLPKPGLIRYNGAHYDDLVSGVYQGMDFTLCEVRLTTGGKHERDVFKGVIVYFNPPHAFAGRLFAAKRLYGFKGFVDDLFGDRSLENIRSGFGELDASYDFRTDHPERATPLVVGPIAQALNYLAEAWPDDIVRLALMGGDAFLLVPTKRNFFELPGPREDIDWQRHVRPMIRDLMTLLAVAQLVCRINVPQPIEARHRPQD